MNQEVVPVNPEQVPTNNAMRLQASANDTKPLWASAAQANNPQIAHALALISDRYQLDPALGEVMVLGNKVYVTLEGYLRIAEEHPQYAGNEWRPMTAEERKAAKVGDQDHAYVAYIYRKDRQHPAIGYGVANENLISAGPLKQFAREIAQKRAMHRALRLAFRAGIPDPENALLEISDAETVGVALQEELPALEAAPAQLPAPDWTGFWTAMKERGKTPEQVHKILGVESIKDWAAPLTDAVQRVDFAIAAEKSKPIKDPDEREGRSLDAMRADYDLQYDKAEALGDPIPGRDEGWSRAELAREIGKARMKVRGLEARVRLFPSEEEHE